MRSIMFGLIPQRSSIATFAGDAPFERDARLTSRQPFERELRRGSALFREQLRQSPLGEIYRLRPDHLLKTTVGIDDSSVARHLQDTVIGRLDDVTIVRVGFAH
jgi:hypothetical protein